MATFTLSDGVEIEMNDSAPPRGVSLEIQSSRTATRFTVRIVDVGVVDVDNRNPLTAFIGTGFTYDASGQPVSGTVTGLEAIDGSFVGVRVDGLSLPVATVIADLQLQDQRQFRNILAGNDTVNGAEGNDYLIGFAGNDVVNGGAGSDGIDGDEEGGAAGNDTVDAGAGNDSVRGLSGDDLVYGGAGNDDVNGNQGQDTVYGGDGVDVVRGGQGADIVYGDGGDDSHVNGNIGNDTVYGGLGNDAMFGGQNDDLLLGEAGNDTLSGDLGNDTLTGGAGGDRFVMGANSPGSDVITDFSFAEGDRIQLPTGTTYTAATVSGSAVLTLSNGGSLTLQGIVASDVQSSWVVFG